MTYVVDGEPVPAGGPEDRLLTWNRVKDIAGISRTTAWRMQKAGDFPEPVTISAKRVGWWESELTAWKASRNADGRAKSLAPPRKPKLIETARSPRRAAPAGRQSLTAVAAPAPRPAPEPPKPVQSASVQGSLFDGPAPSAQDRPRRRQAKVSPDQIDFGF